MEAFPGDVSAELNGAIERSRSVPRRMGSRPTLCIGVLIEGSNGQSFAPQCEASAAKGSMPAARMVGWDKAMRPHP